jgi:TPR repeat protein
MTSINIFKLKLLASLQYAVGSSLFSSGVAGWHKLLHTFAMTQLQRASHKQHQKAQQLMAALLTYRGESPLDKRAGVALLQSAAEKGDASSQFLLAEALLQPDIIVSDQVEQKAVSWYEAAAKQGHPMAALRLSKAYGNGLLGLEKDDIKAQYWSQQFMLHSQNMSSST